MPLGSTYLICANASLCELVRGTGFHHKHLQCEVSLVRFVTGATEILAEQPFRKHYVLDVCVCVGGQVGRCVCGVAGGWW